MTKKANAPSAKDFAIIEARLKLMLEDDKELDARYPLQGRIAGPALGKLVEGGYACRIYYQDLPQYAPDRDERFFFVKTPLVFCALRSTTPGDICAERRISMKIDWQDPDAQVSDLYKQLPSRQIINRVRSCVPESEITR